MTSQPSTVPLTRIQPVVDDMTEVERQVLLCGACQKVFVDPKMLSCGHTLCSACISRGDAAGAEVVCAVCEESERRVVKKSNFRLQSCVDDVKEIKRAIRAAGI